MPSSTSLSDRPSYGRSFSAHGKLMLTGEYLVLDGARALAVPAHRGQKLTVSITEEVDVLHWVSRDVHGAIFLELALTREHLLGEAPPAIDKRPAARVTRLLQYCLQQHPLAWPRGSGLAFEVKLGFERDWGLGSSSTLVQVLASWAAINPFDLNQREFGGSGYDIACAGAHGPIWYALKSGEPRLRSASWQPDYLDQLFFVHLGQKQDSRRGIAAYRQASERGELGRYVAELDELSEAVATAPTLEDFQDALRRHEALVGYVTHQEPLSRKRFAGFPGVVKSLGAWGGDFALVATTEPVTAVEEYFAEHDLGTLLPARELLMTSSSGDSLLPDHPGDWLVFLYGPLAERRMDNEWLSGHWHREADATGYAVHPEELTLRPKVGGIAPGMLVYMSPDEVRDFDLHPGGSGLRRTELTATLSDGRRVCAQAWM